jgi:iron complex outermembrane receptor protein
LRDVRFALSLSGLLLLATPWPAGAQARDINPLKQLSLEDLGNIAVTTISKEPEELRRTPAAIYVITQEDIRRSGFTSLPEILRLAPGINVARIDSTHWAVGVRGFGDQFSKSVLLLIDGRTVYTPLFAGVFWGLQDTVVEDIDRIEVIRGPGGTIWGANAVNGVINVVTKAASATQGTLVSAGTGNVDELSTQVRYGGSRGSMDYRIYGKGIRRGPQAHSDDADFDTARMAQAGGRLDWTGARDSLTLQGDVYAGRIGQSVSLASFAPLSQVVHREPFDASGVNLVAAWRRSFASAGRLQARAYYDRTSDRGPQLEEVRQTFDADLTHQLPDAGRHRLRWGGGLRVSPSGFTQTVPTLDIAPHDHTSRIFSAFVHDDVTLLPERLSLSVGSKLEHYTYGGLEAQPSVRVLWTPTIRHSLWASATRAVRTPSRVERDFTLYALLEAARSIFLRVDGNPEQKSERHQAYETGYRGTLAPWLHLDASVFHNRHDDLASFGEPSAAIETTPPPTRLVLIRKFANGIRGSSQGFEIAPAWTPVGWWQLRGFYSHLRIDLETLPGIPDEDSVPLYEGSSPRHQVQLQSLLTLPGAVELDVTFRRVSALPARNVAAYATTDLRLGVVVTDGLTLSVAGQNLFDASHEEFGHDPPPIVGIRRSVSVMAHWSR